MQSAACSTQTHKERQVLYCNDALIPKCLYLNIPQLKINFKSHPCRNSNFIPFDNLFSALQSKNYKHIIFCGFVPFLTNFISKMIFQTKLTADKNLCIKLSCV